MEKQLALGDAGSVATGDAKAGFLWTTGVPGAFFFSRSAAMDSDARRWKSMAAARKRSDALGPAGLDEGFEAKRAAAVALASAARRFMRCIVVSFTGGGGAWSSSSDSWPLISSVDGTLGGIWSSTGDVGGVWSVSNEENWGETPSGGTGEFRRLTSASAAAGSSGSAGGGAVGSAADGAAGSAAGGAAGSSGSGGGGAVALEPLAIVTTRAPPGVRSFVLAAGSEGGGL